jgi:cytochrome d ubiquinol oxidase subunit I
VTRLLLSAFVASPFLAHVATQAGWFTAEMGRQPWIDYEVLKTGEAVSAVVRSHQVLTSIVLFTIIYLLLSYLFLTLLLRKIRHGPNPVGGGPEAPLPETWRPLSMRSGRDTPE